MTGMNPEQHPLSPLVQAAGGVAIVMLIFAVVITALLSVSVYHYAVTDPQQAAELEQLKSQYLTAPTDTKMAERIEAMDVQLRRVQFARLYFLQHGTALLIIDLAVFVAAAMLRTRTWRTPALPDNAPDRKNEQIRHALQVRTAVTVAAVVVGTAGLYLAQRPAVPPPANNAKPESTAAVADAPAFATYEQMKTQWPSFRGADGSGVCRFENIPDDWDGASGRNILWKSPIPLPGHNSPIIWGERIFLSGATETAQQMHCYDLASGQLLWTGDVAVTPDAAREDMYIMEDTGYAAPTMVTDGIRAAALFAGGDIACFTIAGQKLWQQHLGVPESAYGYAASLAAFERNIIVQYDVTYDTQDSRLIAMDWQTGKTNWQTARPVPNSWTSPTVVAIGQTQQLLTCGSPWVIAYDPRNGRELYRADCLSGDVAPTQILADGKIIAIEPYNNIVALRTDGASGDVTQTHLAWRTAANIPDISSPVSDDTLIWTLSTDGTLTAFDAADGKIVYTQSLNVEVQSSPCRIGEVLYILTVRGTMILAKTGRQYEEIKRLELGEKCYASPAFTAGRIIIRGVENLYCIGAKDM